MSLRHKICLGAASQPTYLRIKNKKKLYNSFTTWYKFHCGKGIWAADVCAVHWREWSVPSRACAAWPGSRALATSTSTGCCSWSASTCTLPAWAETFCRPVGIITAPCSIINTTRDRVYWKCESTESVTDIYLPICKIVNIDFGWGIWQNHWRQRLYLF